uniref:Uncharacterized protein n=1 Tax=Oryza brachyantha TaxID=4533 RepID=J3L9J2_ORYBR
MIKNNLVPQGTGISRYFCWTGCQVLSYYWPVVRFSFLLFFHGSWSSKEKRRGGKSLQLMALVICTRGWSYGFTFFLEGKIKRRILLIKCFLGKLVLC